VSAIPVWLIGFIIGFVGALMGIGGGFLLVPMLIYFLRVPTATVIGTSMVMTLITMPPPIIWSMPSSPSFSWWAASSARSSARGRARTCGESG
jgi:uncharacterized membrane protein YfcA